MIITTKNIQQNIQIRSHGLNLNLRIYYLNQVLEKYIPVITAELRLTMTDSFVLGELYHLLLALFGQSVTFQGS